MDGSGEQASGPGWDLHCGDWRTALAHVGDVDALIVDAPYSERTHSSHNGAADDANRGADYRTRVAKPTGGTGPRRAITYASWTREDVFDFVAHWSRLARGWFVSITDHVLQAAWCEALQAEGRYVFAPLPLVETGSRVRLAGDGPSSWTCWVVVARPATQEFFRWGTLPGSYVDTNEKKPVVGGKPLGLMRALVRDYTRPGDLVCDPCAGGGTTLLAAVTEGRRAVGAELDPAHFTIARKRLQRGFTAPLFTEGAGRPAEQLELEEGVG